MTKIKTVLAPNAPWPKWETAPAEKPKPPPRRPGNNQPRIKFDSDLDYLADTREQLKAIKNTQAPRARDLSTGRFKGGNRISG